MDIKYIGVRKFRANILKYVKLSQKNKKHYIVASNNTQLFEIKTGGKSECGFDVSLKIRKEEKLIALGRKYLQQK